VARHGRAGIVATVAALSLAGCASTVALPSPTATASPAGTPEPTPPTPSPSSTPPAPSGFHPAALSAISESDFWVLGSSGCVSTTCPSEILHTVDGGVTFQRIPAPASVSLAGSPSGSGKPTVSALRFADPSDGWAFGAGPAWATHDGGAHWYELDFNWTFRQLEPGANGYVYAVVEICTTPGIASGCADWVMRSRANFDSWSPISPPGSPSGRPVIGIHGDTVWVMYFGASPGIEWTSHDDGEHWVRGAMPCQPDLGGNFDPVSTTVIWAFCATGTTGGPLVSTNGGASFVDAGGTGGEFWNGAMVAAVSSRYAFVGAGNSALRLTTNAGQSYRSTPQFSNALWVGFTDSEVGYVITLDQTANTSQLWRTSDAGTTWHRVSLT
jgi:photosystem II stability/assembly factor-like uncharacterized protein